MRAGICFLACLVIASGTGFCGAVDTAWVRSYDSNMDLSLHQYEPRLAVDHFGRVYLAATHLWVGGSTDYATVVWNAEGDLLWEENYDGLGSDRDVTADIAVEPAGYCSAPDVFVTGTCCVDPFGCSGILWDYDYVTVRYHGDGSGGWATRAGVSRSDYARAMVLDSHGDVWVTGVCEGQFQEGVHDYLTCGTAGCWTHSGNGDDHALAIAAGRDGSVYVTGVSMNNNLPDPTYDFATIQYPAGLVWRYDDGGYDAAHAIAVNFGGLGVGGIYVTGQSGSDCLTLSYHPDGGIAWEDRYSTGHGENRGAAIATFADTSLQIYVAVESSGGASGKDYALLRYDEFGWLTSEFTYNGPGNGDDIPTAIAVDSYGYVYVTGKSYGGPDMGYDYATLKFSPSGWAVWLMRYGGPGDDIATDIAVDYAGNVYVTGITATPGGDSTCVTQGTSYYTTIKYSQGGTWWSVYEPLAPFPMKPRCGAHTFNGRVDFEWSSVAGATGYTLLVYDSPEMQIPVLQRDMAADSTSTKARFRPKSTTQTYYWVVRAFKEVGLSRYYSPLADGPYRDFRVMALPVAMPLWFPSYANPSGTGVTLQFALEKPQQVSIDVYDVRGRLVRRLVRDERLAAGTVSISWDGRDDREGKVSPGTYFCRVTAEETAQTTRVVLLK